MMFVSDLKTAGLFFIAALFFCIFFVGFLFNSVTRGLNYSIIHYSGHSCIFVNHNRLYLFFSFFFNQSLLLPTGDDITVYGVVMQRWKPFHQDARCDLELVLKANYVKVNNEQLAGVTIDEEVRKEFEDFWEKHRNNPLAG